MILWSLVVLKPNLKGQFFLVSLRPSCIVLEIIKECFWLSGLVLFENKDRQKGEISLYENQLWKSSFYVKYLCKQLQIVSKTWNLGVQSIAQTIQSFWKLSFTEIFLNVILLWYWQSWNNMFLKIIYRNKEKMNLWKKAEAIKVTSLSLVQLLSIICQEIT